MVVQMFTTFPNLPFPAKYVTMTKFSPIKHESKQYVSLPNHVFKRMNGHSHSPFFLRCPWLVKLCSSSTYKPCSTYGNHINTKAVVNPKQSSGVLLYERNKHFSCLDNGNRVSSRSLRSLYCNPISSLYLPLERK